MKIYFLIAIALFAGCSASRPDEKSIPDKTFDDIFREYAAAFNNGQYEHMLSFLPEKTFTKATTQQVIDYYKEIERTIGPTKITEFKFLKYGAIVSRGDSSFRKISYHSTTVNFKKKNGIDSSAFRYLQNLYGREHISYDSIENTYVIDQTKDLIFMKGKSVDWKFLEFDPKKQNKLVRRFVPGKILEQL